MRDACMPGAGTAASLLPVARGRSALAAAAVHIHALVAHAGRKGAVGRTAMGSSWQKPGHGQELSRFFRGAGCFSLLVQGKGSQEACCSNRPMAGRARPASAPDARAPGPFRQWDFCGRHPWHFPVGPTLTLCQKRFPKIFQRDVLVPLKSGVHPCTPSLGLFPPSPSLRQGTRKIKSAAAIAKSPETASCFAHGKQGDAMPPAFPSRGEIS